MIHKIEFAIQQTDISEFDADVIALKHAQGFYGADQLIASRLANAGIMKLDEFQLPLDEFRLYPTKNHLPARNVMFVGMPGLAEIRYSHIRHFAYRVLQVLDSDVSEVQHLAMTIHGVVFGLDRAAVFLAQFAGYMDAFRIGTFPASLLGLSIVDKNPETVQHLRLILEQRLAGEAFASRTPTGAAYHLQLDKTR